ncbi:guanine-specific ribonuclease N1 and T1 [Streptomyces griseoflavus]|uniref:ribonuclease domain-containing protein n=1 Tax=Streptomyces TaxID=1883 RepID=UPI0004C87E72|nr:MULTISPECIES: ribonuclease domain-containing protein [Streptomyces]KOG52012.1 guanine-specific ribonuclease N1 and T1 [Streptomyces griseoflavus]KOT91113.1 guanine-specific ribonuclease N1 and T1 [Streptomyces rimosus subsp. pseudoverticillatus]KOU01706.1 guanine-specific ribonuclease N1 and T1 [Streptomyces sp. NRRL F-5755]
MVIRSAPRAAAGVLAALLACVLLLVSGCSGGGGGQGSAKPTHGAPSGSATAPEWARGMATVPAGRLPAQARETLRLIDAKGPFPYPKDGTVFGNHERLLPRQKRGYYHEYTVPTPGSKDRGARRIVTGDSHETYYTDDHYRTFKAVLR